MGMASPQALFVNARVERDAYIPPEQGHPDIQDQTKDATSCVWLDCAGV